ncbi:MAG: DUF2490 domain-containing protein [Vampirovibrio sp.]
MPSPFFWKIDVTASIFWGLLFLVVGFGLSTPTHAGEATEGTWETLAVTLTPLAQTPKLKVYLEGQLRLQSQEKTTPLERTLLWTGLGYQITPKTSLWSGYAWVPTYNPRFNNEQRLWQAVLHNEPLGGGNLLLRGRVEERLIEGQSTALVNLRTLARYQHSIPQHPKWYGFLQNELIVNANTSSPNNKAGWNQNGSYLGVGRHLTAHVNAELGYMALLQHQANGSTRLENVFMVTLSVLH